MISKRKAPGFDDMCRLFEHPKLASQDLYIKLWLAPNREPFHLDPFPLKAHRLRHRFGHERTEE